MADDDPRNPDGLDWDALVGKYVLVGITRKDMRDNVLAFEQVHARVLKSDTWGGRLCWRRRSPRLLEDHENDHGVAVDPIWF